MTLDDVAAARKQHQVLVVGHDDPVAAGRDILDALRARGLRVHLGADGSPRLGPRELVDEADLAILGAHRDEVMAALR
jgi:hypothetical protein